MSNNYGHYSYLGYAVQGLLGAHRTENKWIALDEAPTISNEISEVNARLLTTGMSANAVSKLQGVYNGTGSFVMSLHCIEGVEFIKRALPTLSSSDLTNAYKHTLTGSDAIENCQKYGLSLTVPMGASYAYYVTGVVVTSIEINAETNNTVKCTVNWVARKVELAAKGTAGTSQGQNAISPPVTLVVDTSDQISLNVDGAGAVEVTITAGAYTAAQLEVAINEAINANSSLLDSDGLPIVACYIDSASKVNFYSVTKGASSSVAWTAGSNDAGTLLGRGTPVEAAGGTTLTTPTISTIQPFISPMVTVKEGTTAINCDKCTITIEPGTNIMAYLGSKYPKETIIEKKRNIAVTVTRNWEDLTEIAAYTGNTDLSIEVNFVSLTDIGETAYDYDANIYLKKVRLTASPYPAVMVEGLLKQELTGKSYNYDATYKDILMEIYNAASTIE